MLTKNIRLKKFGIKKVYENVDKLVNDFQKFDAFLIAISVKPTFEILQKCIKTRKPILVEKPISTDINDFKYLTKSFDNVRVAYNRRFYSTVQFAKKFVLSNQPSFATMTLPDRINFDLKNQEQTYFSVKENSVHGFDILNYLFPNLSVKKISEYKQPNNIFGRKAILKDDKNNTVEVLLNWNSPSNFSLNIEASPYRLELKPFESFKLFNGMEVVEPTIDYPVRQYVPKAIEEGNVFSSSKNKDFKPGFLEQAVEFKKLIEGKKTYVSANLKDAFNASNIAFKISTLHK